MALREEEIRHVLSLARIAASDEEVDRLRRDLSAVIEYMATLNDVRVEGVEPMTHGDIESMALRDDEPRAFGDTESVLREAPEAAEGHYAVPRVVGGEESP